jgi:hypothetical protein
MDVSLLELWAPILLSAVVVFIASSLAWMVLPHHKADWKTLPSEGGFLEGLRSHNVPPGQYMFPCASPKDMKDPEKKKLYESGPHGTLCVLAKAPNMGKNLILTFIFYLVVGLFVAYIGRLALRGMPAADYMDVFRVTGTAAVMAYCLGFIPGSIWFGRKARSTVMDIIDGVVYGLLTAGVFGWLWPKAEAAIPAMPPIGG